MPRKRHNRLLGFSELVKGYSPLLVFFGLLANLFVVIRFETTRKPQVVYCVEKGTATNSVVRSSSAPASVPSSFPAAVPSSAPAPFSVGSSNFPVRVSGTVNYHYWLADGKRAVTIWGRNFSEGSPTSYGRIVTIYPDRLLLDDGSYIVNSQWSGGDRHE